MRLGSDEKLDAIISKAFPFLKFFSCMNSDDEPPQPRRRKWIAITALAGGSVLIAAPLVYLWGIRKHRRISLNSVNAAPPRRVGSLSSSSDAAAASTAAVSRFTFAAPEQLPLQNETASPLPQGSDWDDDNWGVPPQPPDPNDNFNVALYLLKAFGIATLIVSGGAFVGIWGLRRYLEVDNMEDFAAKMKLGIINHMPLLASRMRQSLRLAPESAVDPSADDKLQPRRRWSWDEAQERLGVAYDKGGLGAWAEVAAREVEEEAKLELEKREQLKTGGSRKTE
ncbi:hypothetical protein MVEN_01941100 [Mycena venus]|uniref:Transmembrane protein n=1 Tax=Mycena venus TaxID=2733690 RepID=A0A8H7CJQ0_9AGAR|nr:hypothetical protein MVEN_01941100 [Mycena venus]